MQIILEIINNPIFLAPFTAMVLAQILKSIFHEDPFNIRILFIGAGMPSAHTAAVVALSLSVFITEGASNLAIVTGVLSTAVIIDVLGDKIFARHQEEKINTFLKEILSGHAVHWKHLIGHTITEVLAGIALGITVTLFIFYFI